ncbi:MAG: ATP-binding protein [Alphaproteobacteria bacterium]
MTIATTMACALAAGVVAMTLLFGLGGAFSDLAGKTLPVLSTAGALARAANDLAVAAPALATSRSSVELAANRDSTLERRRDLLQVLDELEGALAGTALSDAPLQRVRATGNALLANIEALDEAAGRHIAAQFQFDLLVARANEAHKALSLPAFSDSAGVLEAMSTIPSLRPPARQWRYEAADLIWEAVTATALADHAIGQAQIESLRARWQALSARFTRLTPDIQAALSGIHATVDQLLVPDSGVLGRAVDLADAEREVETRLADNRRAATALVSATVTLFNGISTVTDRQREAILENVSAGQLTLAAIMAISVGAGFLGVVLFRQRVLDRIKRLQVAMRRGVNGEFVKVDDADRDEIAQMARAHGYFIDAIAARESRLKRERDIQRQLAAEAEAASRAKSMFLANMSHELRTPLNAIIGFSDLLCSAPADPARVKEYSADINSSGRHLLSVINDVLEFSKIEAGRAELSIEATSLAEAVGAAHRFVRLAAQERAIAIAVELVGPSVIQADPVALRQVFANLLSNAAKFARADTTINVVGKPSESGDSYRISVIDQGVGISADQLDKVLQPFHQERSSYTRGRGGTGLGLAITRSLVELHGGTLRIQSEKGVGTTVIVSLPYAGPGGAAAGEPADGAGGTSAAA